jgi:hypothetical protein
MTSFVDQLRSELVAAAAREQARTRPRLALPPLRPLVLATAGLAVTVLLVLAVAGALRSDHDAAERPVKPPAPEGRPVFGGTLFPGERYRTRALIPALSFVVADDNWEARETEQPDVFVLTRVTRGGPGPPGPQPALGFQRIRELYDPGIRSRKAARIPAPEDLHAWLARHPDLQVSGSEPVTVGGVRGTRFLVEVSFARPAHSDPFCRETFRRTCTFIGPRFSVFDGMRLHVTQLRVEGAPFVIFTVASSPRKLAAVDRVAAPVLDSLRIGIR